MAKCLIYECDEWWGMFPPHSTNRKRGRDMEEIWKDIPGYEGIYQVSNLGNVKSLNYLKRGYSQNLKFKTNNQGYYWVQLWNNGNYENKLVHRIVAETFIKNPFNLPIINHKDENPRNCNVKNLEWCDHKYNVNYSIKLHPERKNNPRGKRRKYSPYVYTQGIIQLSLSGEFVNKYSSISECVRQNGYNNWSIRQCCVGERKTAYGYKWRFAEK